MIFSRTADWKPNVVPVYRNARVVRICKFLISLPGHRLKAIAIYEMLLCCNSGLEECIKTLRTGRGYLGQSMQIMLLRDNKVEVTKRGVWNDVPFEFVGKIASSSAVTKARNVQG
jgi:hypothetical protein